MSESARRHKYKWDYQEDTHLRSEISQRSVRPGKAGDYVLDGDRNYLKVDFNTQGSKWTDIETNDSYKSKGGSDWSSWEPLPDNTSFDYDGAREQNYDRSPKRSWARSYRGRSRSRSQSRSRSRSRSRSKSHDFKREYIRSDRGRSGSHLSSRPCKDFAAGKCRWGSQCKFLHQDSVSHKNHYDRDHAHDYHPRNNSRRLSNLERSDRISAVDRNRNREIHRGTDPSCKYFSLGKCRDGDYCRYSHDGPAVETSGRSSRDDRWARSHNSDTERGDRWDQHLESDDKSWNGRKSGVTKHVSKIERGFGQGDIEVKVGDANYTDIVVMERARDDRPAQKSGSGKKDDSRGHNRDYDDKLWTEKKWNDTKDFSGIVKSSGWSDIGDKVGDLITRDQMVMEKSRDDRSVDIVNNEKRSSEEKGLENDKSWNDKRSDTKNVSEMETEWFDININARDVISSEPMAVEKATEHRQPDHVDKDINQSSFEGNGGNNFITEIPSGISGTSEVLIDQTHIHVMAADDIIATGDNSLNKVTLEHMSNSFVSQPLSGINAITWNHLPSAKGHSFDLNGPVSPFSSQTQEMYDPLSDSIELNKPNTNNQTTSLSSDSMVHKTCPSPHKSSQEFIVIKTVAEKEQEKQLEEGNKERANGTEEGKKEEENSADEGKKEVENVHGVEEGTGSKDDKGMKMFRVALVEFVKEILKPTWKGGQLSREVHKTIVKKVVDKVTGTLQGDHVPKTQEQIDRYMSFSKLKLTKLVEAYVQKYVKP